MSANSHRIGPAVSGVKFDTAHRKKASPNIFENVNQDVLVKLFEKSGDLKAQERARTIHALCQDPEGIAKALMALQQDKKDRFLLITGLSPRQKRIDGSVPETEDRVYSFEYLRTNGDNFIMKRISVSSACVVKMSLT
ncbi:hypothetical protein DNTS_025909 [Danionella cerebrum]|uniref:Arginine vasopressin-induced protein 1/transcriptional and immune response regulator domain-containing protein n=1 Tax=Danionella cerebrum TaxID=2873325 RepID=A0A553MWV8_9TELE|nr:hypothetical protein DNTS_025909 [Danionella translucida]